MVNVIVQCVLGLLFSKKFGQSMIASLQLKTATIKCWLKHLANQDNLKCRN